MRVKCPECATTFELPESAVNQDRPAGTPFKLRCFKCKQIFDYTGDGPEDVSTRDSDGTAILHYGQLDKENSSRLPGTNSLSSQPPQSLGSNSSIPGRVELKSSLLSSKSDPPQVPSEESSSESELQLETPPISFVPEPPMAGSVSDSSSDLSSDKPISVAPSMDSLESSNDVSNEPLLDGELVNQIDAGQPVVSSSSEFQPDPLKGTSASKPGQRWILIASIGLGLVVAVVLFLVLGGDGNRRSSNGDQNASESSGSGRGEPTENMQVKLIKDYKLRTKDNRTIVVLVGTVKNDSAHNKNKVQLEGRLVDTSGNIRSKTVAPCGRIATDKRLKRMKKGKLDLIFKAKGQDFNCRIKSGQKKRFKMIFEEVPGTYDSTFKFEVKPVNAEFAESKQVE